MTTILACENRFDSANCRDLSNFTPVPTFKLYNDKIVMYDQYDYIFSKKHVNKKSLENLKKERFNGLISASRKKYITQKLTCWLNSIQTRVDTVTKLGFKAKYYPIFCTLTLSSEQQHQDQYLKRELLGQFILELKKYHNVKYYFWRAESQKNGNIHFHLILDKYIPYAIILDRWNRIQNKLGYVDKFKEKVNRNNPNSVDVKGVKDVDNFVNYILKYAVKEEKYRKIKGRLYGMSDELRYLDLYTAQVDNYFKDKLEKSVIDNQVKMFVTDYATVFYFNKSFYSTALYSKLKKDSSKYYSEVYNMLYKNIEKKEKQLNQRFHSTEAKEYYTQMQLFQEIELSKPATYKYQSDSGYTYVMDQGILIDVIPPSYEKMKENKQKGYTSKEVWK